MSQLCQLSSSCRFGQAVETGSSATSKELPDLEQGVRGKKKTKPDASGLCQKQLKSLCHMKYGDWYLSKPEVAILVRRGKQ